MGKQPKLKQSEDEIQIAIVEYLSSICRVYGFLFFAVPNEAAMKSRSGKSVYPLIAHLKKMGLVPGVSDLVIGFRGLMYGVEVKTESGKQNPNQKLFEGWCRDCHIVYQVVRSVKDMEHYLRRWGIVR